METLLATLRAAVKTTTVKTAAVKAVAVPLSVETLLATLRTAVKATAERERERPLLASC